ncbi:hypothetical protein B0A50_07032 [Salinomyces thailandicus]|uniref:Uncharacterized protein n=1 Tax=Salinomyces thailandicus TaxID=706561 RepID=A0A4U0TP08_9PEZI|nr:hypothetical protein B0A50_07032 [Salinomyces thailandica]
MSPPGRRRGSTLSLPVLLLALLFLFTSTASAASSVLGLDFGTLNLKAALVKPGIPLEIVLTKDSKRKESAAVAFKPSRDASHNIIAEIGTFPERAYGGDALALQGRMPGEVFPNLKPLLGLPWTEGGSNVVEGYRGRYPAANVVQVKEMGTTMIKSSAFHEGEMPWSVEELLAMELANIKHNAETMAGKGQSVDDVVITIPAFYTADERRAIGRAADLAGLEVNALISDGLAVGLDYAKSRTFPDISKGEKPEYHIVYDMGAGSTTATLMRFQAKSVKDVGRFNKTVQEVTVLGTGWDRTLGGDSFNQAMLDDYVHKFLTKPVMKSRGTTAEEVKSNARAMSRLWKEVEKARQVLSANSETFSSFEELLPEIDFKTKLTRADFEELVQPFTERVAEPIQDALAAAKMSIADVDSIVLHGGVVRTPFVQRKLEGLAGGSKKLRSNVNADESAVFGAAFKGAGLSPSFKVKEIRNSDVAGYAAGMIFTDGGKERKQQLFSASSPVGNGAATKQVTFKDTEDFVFGLYQVINSVERPISRVQTNNLTASVAELKTKFGCETEDVQTRFGMRLSAVDGLPEVISGVVSCEVEGSGKGGSVGDTVKDWFGFGGKKDQEPLDGEDEGPIEEVDAATSVASSGADGESATASSNSASTSASKAPEKPKKRTESIPIALSTSSQGNPQPAPEEIKRMRDRLVAFDRSDRARFAREEALNVLESYTYFVRDFLSNTDYSAFSTETVRGDISKLLDSARGFMEDPGQVTKATEETFRERLTGLKTLVEPIQSRRREESARPEKVEKLKESLGKTNKMVDMVREQIAKASEAVANAAETSTESSSTTMSTTDDFDDLEEPDTASSSTTAAPKPSSFADFSPYTDSDLTSIEEAYETVSKWLQEKESEQGKLKPFEDPVLSVKELEAQASKLSNVMADLMYKKTQRSKSSSSSSSSSKKAKSSKTKSAKKSSKTSSSSSTTSAPADEATSVPVSEEMAGKPKVVTMKPGEELPSEEELVEMVGEVGDGDDTANTRDEL